MVIRTSWNCIINITPFYDFMIYELRAKKAKYWPLFLAEVTRLTHCGLVMPYGNNEHRSESTLTYVMACGLTAPSHYGTNIVLSSVRFKDIHMRAFSQGTLQPSITEISLKITYLRFNQDCQGANELTVIRARIWNHIWLSVGCNYSSEP